MNRRSFVALLAGTAMFPSLQAMAQISSQTQPRAIQVLKTASCGCCGGWVTHLRRNGYQVAVRDVPLTVLNQEKLGAGIQSDLASCHTARIAGYVIEGHVPARDIARLLQERPAALGLALPGMPLGSPGMDSDTTEPHEVLLVRRDGSTEIFARYS
jgi:hypothetical protein